MKYMLDTNICIYLIKHSSPNLLQKFLEKDPEDFCISVITYSELMYGVEKSQKKNESYIALMTFLANIKILDFNSKAADAYANIRAKLEKNGKPIGNMDQLIAAHALSRNLTIVTNNEREFIRVEKLKVENWVS